MNVVYTLANVEIVDFQMPETKPQGGNIQLNCSFSFGIVPNASGMPDCIECTGAYSYIAGMFVAMSAEVKETFRIEQHGWVSLKEGNRITIPQALQKQLAVTVTDTARGVMAAHAKGTWLEPYFLPMIDPAAMIKEDLRFEAQVLDA